MPPPVQVYRVELPHAEVLLAANLPHPRTQDDHGEAQCSPNAQRNGDGSRTLAEKPRGLRKQPPSLLHRALGITSRWFIRLCRLLDLPNRWWTGGSAEQGRCWCDRRLVGAG
jgi:hypothetical protein